MRLHPVGEARDRATEKASASTTELAQLVEEYLLDKLLVQRRILTPYDITVSPTFFDVGLLSPRLFSYGDGMTRYAAYAGQ